MNFKNYKIESFTSFYTKETNYQKWKNYKLQKLYQHKYLLLMKID